MSDIEKSALPRQKVVCVLGMHRSGTSMTTRVLNLMGVFLGKIEKMFPANKNDNEEGFWEHIEIIKIHEEILRKLNSYWESTRPLPDKWWELPDIKQYKIRLLELVKSEFGNVTLWGFKDPRTCIMLPLWKEIFEVLNIEPMFIIPVRNPIDTANSLIKRDGFSLNHSLRLWYYYMINIIEGTKGHSRIFIEYDDMIENIDLSLVKLEDFLSIDVSEDKKNLVKESLKPNLRHSKTSQKELELIANEQVVGLYNICMKFIKNPYSEIDLKMHSCELYKLYGDFMDVQYADKKCEILMSSLYIDYGMGYKEETSIKQRISMNEKNEFNIKFQLEKNGESIKNLRWDPMEGRFCKCVIDNIVVNNTNVKIESFNADYINGNNFDFLTVDPIYIWQNHFHVVETVSICGKISFYKSSELQWFLQEEKRKFIEVNEKSNYYQNENNLLINDRNQIISENKNNQLTRENEVMNTINELENRYKILQENNMRLDKEYQLILNSPSWRITKPLRSIKRVILKLIKKKTM